MPRTSKKLARRRATVPFPAPAAEPTEAYEIEIPASSEARLLCFEFFQPEIAKQAHPVRGQAQINLEGGSVVLVGIRPILESGLLAGNA